MLDPSFLNNVNTDIIPDTDATRSLGADDKRWKYIYLYDTIYLRSRNPEHWYILGYVVDIGVAYVGSIWAMAYRTAYNMYHAWYRRTSSTDPTPYLLMYLKTTGDLYVRGSYQTFSPELPTLAEVRKNPEIAYKELRRIACIPSSEGKLEHIKDEKFKYFVLEKAFAKDISKTALLNARMVVILYEKVKQLEEENKMLRDKLQKLEQELQEIKQALAR